MSPMDEQTLIIIATLHEILIYDNEVGHRHHRVIYANLLIWLAAISQWNIHKILLKINGKICYV